MTREEEFEKAIYDYSKKFEKKMNGIDYFNHEHIEHAFIDGIEWADNNPKSPWINYKEEKPSFGVEVIAYHHKWVDEDFNPNGTRIGFLSNDGFTSAFWWNYQDCYETISKSHCDSNRDFYRNYVDNVEPEFWMPIPESPKQIKD